MFLTYSILVANPKKLYFTRWPTLLVVCCSEKREEDKKYGSAPPHPPYSLRGNTWKIKKRIFIPRRYAGLGPSRASVCDNNFPSLVSCLYLLLTMSSRVYLFYYYSCRQIDRGMKFYWSTAPKYINGATYSYGRLIPGSSNGTGCRTVSLGTSYYTMVSTRGVGSDNERPSLSM